MQPPYSKLLDDAFTRVRVILMNGIESEALRFSHACARMNGPLQAALAQVRRVEQHQQTMVKWLNPPDQSPLETTIGFEQVAIEVTASVAQAEPVSDEARFEEELTMARPAPPTSGRGRASARDPYSTSIGCGASSAVRSADKSSTSQCPARRWSPVRRRRTLTSEPSRWRSVGIDANI